jgi:hypothetical protein
MFLAAHSNSSGTSSALTKHKVYLSPFDVIHRTFLPLSWPRLPIRSRERDRRLLEWRCMARQTEKRWLPGALVLLLA